jgi:hypothetical protein
MLESYHAYYIHTAIIFEYFFGIKFYIHLCFFFFFLNSITLMSFPTVVTVTDILKLSQANTLFPPQRLPRLKSINRNIIRTIYFLQNNTTAIVLATRFRYTRNKSNCQTDHKPLFTQIHTQIHTHTHILYIHTYDESSHRT